MSVARAKVQPRATAGNATGAVRLIGGLWKRSKLPVLHGPGLRPTPDRVRETLFNWLGQRLDGLRCLDAFAGSGALGLEAASRGAAQVLLLEREARLVQSLRAQVQRLGAQQVQVQQADALLWMQQAAPAAWDLIFLDPPFQAADQPSLFEAALGRAQPLLADGGLIYLEAPAPWSDAALAAFGLTAQRRGRAAAVHYHLLQGA